MTAAGRRSLLPPGPPGGIRVHVTVQRTGVRAVCLPLGWARTPGQALRRIRRAVRTLVPLMAEPTRRAVAAWANDLDHVVTAAAALSRGGDYAVTWTTAGGTSARFTAEPVLLRRHRES